MNQLISFQQIKGKIGNELKQFGIKRKANQWQARDVSVGMHELNNVHLSYSIPETQSLLEADVKPDQPWADEHFAERVSGIPMNPAPSYKNWPYYKQDEKWRPDGIFAHTYPERMWVSRIDKDDPYPNIEGVRYSYGDLGDVVKLLTQDPYTRQAFLPIWFPEDTGAHHGERVPCTIGYHFLLVGDGLDIFYTIRSCDYRRHFTNDVYFASRLCQWMIEELSSSLVALENLNWGHVRPGKLHMHIYNLHVFDGEEAFI